MKHIGAYLGSPQETANEFTALWFKRTGSGKLIWPGQKYVVVKRFYDDMGRPPIKNLSWDRVYTPNEYLLYQLTRDDKPVTGQQFTGMPYRYYIKE